MAVMCSPPLIQEIPTWLSLLVILLTLVVTTVASLRHDRKVRERRLARDAGAAREAADVQDRAGARDQVVGDGQTGDIPTDPARPGTGATAARRR